MSDKPKGFLHLSAFALGISILINLYHEWLIAGSSVLSHDNFYWNYPVFHFFAENLLLGQIPWWNPFSHGGEPFYPAMMQIRLFDPLAFLTIEVGQLFTHNILLLHGWFRFLQGMVLSFGAYLYLCSHTQFLWIRLILIPALLLSSWTLGPFRADGLVNHFLWVPYALLLLDQIFLHQKNKPRYWVALGGIIGLTLQSYFFVGLTILIPIFLFVLRKHRPSLSRLPFTLLMVVLMADPNLVLFSQRADFVFPSRTSVQEAPPGGNPMLEAGQSSIDAVLDYSTISSTGSHWSLWNLLQTLAPEGNHFYRPPDQSDKSWGHPSDTYMYFGFFLWVAALFGIFFGQHPLKRTWLVTGAVFLLITLLSNTPVYRWIVLFPPLKLIRHTNLLLLYLEFCFLFFMVLGLEALLSRAFKMKSALFVCFLALISFQVALILYFSPERFLFLTKMFFFLLVPLLSFVLLPKKHITLVLIFLTVSIDLFLHTRAFSFLYLGTPNPQALLMTDAQPQTPRLLARGISPPCPDFMNRYLQCPRYLELLYREPFLFSALRHSPHFEDPLENAWKSTRWDSFYLLKSHQSTLQSMRTVDDLSQTFGVGQPAVQYSGEGTLSTRGYSYNQLWLEIDAQSPGELQWSDAYTKDWSVYVNKEKKALLHHNFVDKRVALSAGKHAVLLSYDPKLFRLATALFEICASLTLALLLLVGLRPQDRPLQEKQPTPLTKNAPAASHPERDPPE